MKTCGKIILSGEHAVLYNRNAISVPYFGGFTYSQISDFYSTDLIKNITEYFCHTFGFNPPSGLEVWSDLPIGCGFGSSASVVVSVVRTLQKYYKLDLDIKTQYNFSKSCEDFIHGKSSGLDVLTVLLEKAIYRKDGVDNIIDFDEKIFSYENSGKPLSSTKDCIQHVQNLIMPILQDFTLVTSKIYQGILDSNLEMIKQSITENHDLLCKIEVVPHKIIEKIRSKNLTGVVGKVSGAGATTGDYAGAIVFC